MDAVGPSDRLRAAWTGVQRHLSVVVGLLSAVGFFFGYLSVSLFAWGLGVAPQDLGLTTQDYVTLASLWLLLIATFVGAGFVFHRLMLVVWERPTVWRRLLLWFPYFIAAVYVAAGLFGTETLRRSPATWAVFCVVVATAVALVAARLATRRAAVLLFLAVMSVVVTIAGTYRFAVDLKRETAHRADVPFLISIVLPVHEGTMTVAGRRECVLRVSDRVYVLAGVVHVDTTAEAFEPGDCR